MLSYSCILQGECFPLYDWSSCPKMFEALIKLNTTKAPVIRSILFQINEVHSSLLSFCYTRNIAFCEWLTNKICRRALLHLLIIICIKASKNMCPLQKYITSMGWVHNMNSGWTKVCPSSWTSAIFSPIYTRPAKYQYLSRIYYWSNSLCATFINPPLLSYHTHPTRLCDHISRTPHTL